jgi:hypothetical protein
MWWGFLSNMVWGIMFIVCVIIFKNLGSLGLALSYFISYAINTVIFVPFYLSRNVVPKNLLISPEVFLIWIVLIIQTIMTLLNVNLWIRFISLIVSIIILIVSFYRIGSLNLNLGINR